MGGDNVPRLDILKGKLVENSKTYADCANTLNISVTTFNDKMNGKRKFTVEEANALSGFIGLNNQEKIEIFLS